MTSNCEQGLLCIRCLRGVHIQAEEAVEVGVRELEIAHESFVVIVVGSSALRSQDLSQEETASGFNVSDLQWATKWNLQGTEVERAVLEERSWNSVVLVEPERCPRNGKEHHGWNTEGMLLERMREARDEISGKWHWVLPLVVRLVDQPVECWCVGHVVDAEEPCIATNIKNK